MKIATFLTTKHNFAKNGILEHTVLLQIWREPAYPKVNYYIFFSFTSNDIFLSDYSFQFIDYVGKF